MSVPGGESHGPAFEAGSGDGGVLTDVAPVDEEPPPAQPAPPKRKRRWWRRVKIALAVVAIPFAWFAWSFGSYVAHDNGDTVSQRAVTWGRDHHLGGVIDFFEKVAYSKPPSKHAAKHLTLSPTATTPAVRTPVTNPASTPAPSTPPQTSVSASPTTAVSTLPGPLAPTPLAPSVSPALDGEGQWRTIASAAGKDAIWATSIRPLPAYPSVVASLAEFDQTNLRFGLFNGTEVPGHGPWRLENHVPPALQSSLVAAFNGGFRFEHIHGGYKTEGRMVKPLINGEATLAISRDGKLFLGEYGRDLTDDGTWISLRENLPLLIDNGVSQVALKTGTWWGADYHNVIYVIRSAVCAMPDGRYAYVTIGKVDATMLGQALVNLGCRRAIQLDINGTWPTFFTFSTSPSGARTGVFLDSRMGGSRTRYLTGSTKEFFALFDGAAVPAGSPLDGP